MGVRSGMLCLVVLVLAFARSADADPIRVTGGALDFDGFSAPLTLTGNRGFTFTSFVDAAGGAVDFAFGGCGGPCDPGTTVSLGAFWSGNDLLGTATVDGRTFDNVGSLSSDTSAQVRFSGMMFVPPVGGQSATRRSLFAFDGLLTDNSPEHQEVFVLIGRGTATGTFNWLEGLQQWNLDRVVFRLEESDPVPEPATLLLTLTGFGGIIARRWQRRQ